ncbi:MAG TPA: prepilin-type N-terminal cleavage/methylation domain-containing protein [Syntrophales bacterium]|jgi:prepilin-type N-terminal cleavage/methylation domain-containing protein|nr:prepilin-type N-terminal cleavage/methylation domain-containing protein [Syntrophales bacterium]HPI58079.1 prepilin-type N-terminal cleavage/methylation domain-containing protein [Syntrophales bacterium]HPN25295.1 prepilin-type N-terminal cleavage/methylation domain-containing protein [Syntrophales bacterium]HQM29286.1 prepilin-type N-terminal cleavage/methylation domain-containing protein [Syntrophales bacterium]
MDDELTSSLRFKILSKMKDQKGFTLIEIIAVLVILGILSAVAIPKYFNLQEEAKKKATLLGLAEGKARVTQYGAQEFLKTTNWPALNSYNDLNLGTSAGDFRINFVPGTTNVQITVTGTAPFVKDATAMGTIRPVIPGT